MNRAEFIKLLRFAAVLIAGALVLAACQPTGSPGKAIERYLEAVTAKDSDRAVTASCASWEDPALQEVDSFKAVDVALKDVSCAESGEDGDAKLVACTGSIEVSYNAESRVVSLEGKTYRAVQEGGDWRMCGYK